MARVIYMTLSTLVYIYISSPDTRYQSTRPRRLKKNQFKSDVNVLKPDYRVAEEGISTNIIREHSIEVRCE